MKNLNVKTGDTVVVITGKDAGKQGKVLSVNPSKNRIVVEGVNIVSRHQKARKAQEKSSIVKKEGSIDVSNVMVVCPVCGKATRVKHMINEEGKNVRICKCGASLDKKFVKETKKIKKQTAEEVKAEKAEKAKAEKPEAVKKTAEKKVKATSVNKEAAKPTAARKSQRGV
ncbi:MAG: 50S ribosomal protein L24 [Clostridia bacterium]|nr:50S ribosomal protein L24 [Clostridia bacterium]